MKRRQFGTAGEVPTVGFGTWHLELGDRAQAVRALRAALDAGALHVDTAELYGDGVAEEIVGEAIEGRRDQLFVVSKVLPSNADRKGVRRACEASLKRLGTDRLDCYLLHWPGEHPLEETFAALEELEAEGKLRSWGVSNFDAAQLEEAVRLAGAGRIACNQVLYNLEERYAESKLLPVCEKHGVALVGYSPFGSGSFPSATSAGGRALAKIAAARGATPYQLALAFLTRLPNTFAIPKAGDVAHAIENAAAGDLELTKGELDRIEAAFPDRSTDELPVL